MTIGQALAFMRSAEQLKDYQNRLNAQPTIDWRDVTQPMSGPQAPQSQYASMPTAQEAYAPMPIIPADDYAQYEEPVGPPDQYAVESPIAGEPYVYRPLPPEPLGPAPFDYGAIASQSQPGPISPASQFAAYQQRVGAVGPDLFARDFYEPQTQYAAGPTYQPGSFAMYQPPTEEFAQAKPTLPPPPIPGAPKMEAQAMMRPQVGTTDIPAEEPVTPGASLAMLTEPTKAEEEKKPTWSPGQEFNVKLNLGGKEYDAVVPRYTPTKTPKTIDVVLTTSDGKQRSVKIDPKIPEHQESYQAIVGKYKELLPKVDTEYSAKIKVDDQWYDAKVDEATNKIIYKDPELGVLSYNKPVTSLTENEFQGPVDETGRRDQTVLQRLQETQKNWMLPEMNKITSTFSNWSGGHSKPQMRARLTARIRPSEGGDEGPVGGFDWYYRTDEGGQIPISEAISSGLVPGDLSARLQEESDVVKGEMNARARSAQAIQSAEPEDLDARDLAKATKALAYWDRERAIRTGAEKKQAESKYKEMQDRIDEINSRTGGVINMGGGVQVVRGPGATRAYSIDPTDINDVLALYSGAPSVVNPQVAPNDITPLTEDDVAKRIADKALSKTSEPVGIADTTELDKTIQGGLNPMLRRIQDAINVARKNNPDLEIDDFIRNQDAEFILVDKFGRKVEPGYVRMPLQDALDNLKTSAATLSEVAKTNNMASYSDAVRAFNNAGMLFTSAIKIPNIEENNGWFTPTREERVSLGNLSDIEPVITPAKPLELYVVPQPSATFPTQVIAPEEQQALQQPRAGGSTKTPPPTVQAFPLISIPGAPTNQQWSLVDGNFSIATQIPLDKSRYEAFARNYSKTEVGPTTRKAMAALSFDDSNSSVSPDIEAETASAIQNLNKAFTDPANTEIRASYANLWHDMMEKAGFDIWHGRDNMRTAFESVYNKARSLSSSTMSDAQKEAEMNKELNNFMSKFYGVDPNADRGNRKTIPMARSFSDKVLFSKTSGRLAGNLAGIPAGSQYKSKLGNASRLMDNLEQAAYETALLYAAAGFGKTGYRSPSDYTTTTWLINPIDSNQLTNYRSGITIPGTLTGDVVNVVDFAKAGQAATSAATSGVATLPVSSADVGVDPVYSGLLYNAPQLLSTSDYQKIRNEVDSAIDGIARKSESAYRSRGTDLASSSSNRPADNKNTRWGPDSPKAVKRYWIESIFLGNLFAPKRDRTIFGSGGSFPGFKISNMK